jgi:hypothetical protein
MKPTGKSRLIALFSIWAFALVLAVPALADTFGTGANSFSMSFVPIGNTGNPNDTTGYGAVPYAYNIAVTTVSVTMLQDAVTSPRAMSHGTRQPHL